jgi:hypothetical protein
MVIKPGDLSMNESHPKITLGLSAVPIKQETLLSVLSVLLKAEHEDFFLIKY